MASSWVSSLAALASSPEDSCTAAMVLGSILVSYFRHCLLLLSVVLLLLVSILLCHT